MFVFDFGKVIDYIVLGGLIFNVLGYVGIFVYWCGVFFI